MHHGSQSILFDLDGTLLDTGLDMGGALNRVLESLGHSVRAVTCTKPNPKLTYPEDLLIVEALLGKMD